MESSDARILRGAAIPTGLAGLAAIVVSLVAAGSEGAFGALTGLVVVLAFFGISLLAIAYSARVSPQILMPVAMGTYLFKIFAMLGLVVLLRDATWMNGRAFGLTVVLCTLVWLIFEVRTFLRTKMLYVDPVSSGPGQR